MSRLVAGLASSHAFTIEEPAGWSVGRERNRAAYARRYGEVPPLHPRVAAEMADEVEHRYGRVRDGLLHLKRKLEQTRVEALILVADDQNENFTEATLPQIAVFRGEEFVAVERGQSQGVRYRAEVGLAEALLEGAVAADIDMSIVGSFPGDELRAHAFAPILRLMDPHASLPVVLVFVNAIHPPAPSPGRCYYLGQTIRQVVERYQGLERVAIYASGGLSHFTAGYPWRHYMGPYHHGDISEAFDRELLARMAAGEGHALATLTSADLLAHGDIEFRSWLTLLGAVGSVRPELLVYEAFYSAIMGMGVGCWNLDAV
jgi:hypothetical protein